jgi:hypothetical protein
MKFSALVPAQAGTHNHQGFGYRWRCHIAWLRRMGPACAGTTTESIVQITERVCTQTTIRNRGSVNPSAG